MSHKLSSRTLAVGVLAAATLAAPVLTAPSSAMPRMSRMMQHKMISRKMMGMGSGMMMNRQRVMLMAAPPAKAAGLQGAKGYADIDMRRDTVKLTVTLAPGTALPPGSVLEGWLSTAGKSTASMADQKFGPAFGKKDLAMKSREVPYALSTGLLRRVGNSRTYSGRFHIDNPLTPYGGVAVTLESDGNRGTYDPRPGTPLLVGMIK